jgi:hypothetical protein
MAKANPLFSIQWRENVANVKARPSHLLQRVSCMDLDRHFFVGEWQLSRTEAIREG